MVSQCILRYESPVKIPFETNDVAHQLSLISLIGTHLTSPVDHVNCRHPLIASELCFTSKVVHVLDERGHKLPKSWVSLGAKRVNDLLCEGLTETLFLGSTAGISAGCLC